jgi:hypothetical protein
VLDGSVGVDGGDGGSMNRMRRSMITLALRKDTPGSLGKRWIGMGTRSRGPTGVVGELTEYRIDGE